ncbi:hypothetical protein ACF08M_34715 [Streptomyces sp. NPDC015032]|uniref:hypothetical protein n=1 Tax=Streptomyces sp. NPDC015032 TaxID=3364937 RepID=UPI0036FA44E8
MHDIDLSSQIDRLRHLAAGFEALRSQVLALALALAPGTTTLRSISPVFHTAQGLTARLTAQVSELASSPYTTVAGSMESLDALCSAIGSSALASCDLAHAMARNPLDGTGFCGPTEHEARFREARHAKAVPVMAEHLQDAAGQLDLCATVCAYVATGMSKDIAPASTNTVRRNASQTLSDTQYEALGALATGGAKMETKGRGSAHVAVPDGSRVTIATFQSLDKRGLVHLDTSVPLFRGRDITVTADGHRVLAHRRSSASAAAVPAPAAPAAIPARGARR